ncbi:MAG: bifunctional riboflavin kinase/FAD synthetase [Flavobacteriaceae bacterium]
MRSPFQASAGGAVPAELRGAVVAIGNFDGVHCGHQAVLGHATSIARETGRKALALTFEPHPRTFFVPDKPIFRLTPRLQKRRLFAAIGLDGAVEMDFDAGLAAMPADDFIADVLRDRLAAAHVVAGFDFHFGKGRTGSPATLVEAGPAMGFGVTIEEAHGDDGGTVFSSSAVRVMLGDGAVGEAAEMLGYHWFVAGEVLHGEKRGRTLGYPTANMALAPECTLRHGVYAVFARHEGRVLPGVASFGRRPQFDNGAPLLETFLFDFDGDLYGTSPEIAFISFIRDEMRFDGVDALVARMDEDSAAARAAFAALRLTAIDRFLAGGPAVA